MTKTINDKVTEIKRIRMELRIALTSHLSLRSSRSQLLREARCTETTLDRSKAYSGFESTHLRMLKSRRQVRALLLALAYVRGRHVTSQEIRSNPVYGLESDIARILATDFASVKFWLRGGGSPWANVTESTEEAA